MPSASAMFRGTRRHYGVMDRRVRKKEDEFEDTLARIAAKRAGVPYFKLDALQPDASPDGAPGGDAAETPPDPDGRPPAPAGESPSPSGMEELTATSGKTRRIRFADIVSPLSPEEFFDGQAERSRPMLFRGPADRFEDFVTWRDLDRLVCSGRRDASQLRVVMEGQDLPFTLFAMTTPTDGLGNLSVQPDFRFIDARKLASFLRQGATLIVNRVNLSLDRVSELAQALEAGTQSTANINLYAAWKSVQGFRTHWDDHDVFVVQARGEKLWRVHGLSRVSPTRFDVEVSGGAPGDTFWSGRLTAGDVLYIPRGWWHDAQGDPDKHVATVHLTCSVRPRDGADILTWLKGRMTEHELFRRELPLMAGDDRWAAHVEAFCDLLESVLRESPAPELARRIRNDFRNRWTDRRGPRLGPSLDPWRTPDWDRYRLRLRGREHSALRRDGPEGAARLTANRATHELDPYCLPLIERLAGADSVSVAELKSLDPGRFDGTFVDDFARELLNRGVAAAIPPA